MPSFRRPLPVLGRNSFSHFGMPSPTEDLPEKPLIQGDPEAVGPLSPRLKHIDDAVEIAIGAGELPGAVVLVARHGQLAYFEAFGSRSLKPAKESMTVDTIFDVSSLHKGRSYHPFCNASG